MLNLRQYRLELNLVERLGRLLAELPKLAIYEGLTILHRRVDREALGHRLLNFFDIIVRLFNLDVYLSLIFDLSIISRDLLDNLLFNLNVLLNLNFVFFELILVDDLTLLVLNGLLSLLLGLNNSLLLL